MKNPKNKNLKAEWDKAADFWNQDAGDTGVWHQRYNIDPAIFKILGEIKNKKILEIGCGNGYFSRLLAKKEAKVTGIDVSEKLLQFAINKEKLLPLGIRYLHRNAADLHGLKNKSFDIIVINMAIMDITDVEDAIKEAYRILKKDGQFIFSLMHPVFSDWHQQWTIIKDGEKRFLARAIAKYKSSFPIKIILWASGVKATHYHRSIETYFQYLFKAGFVVNEFKELITKKKIKKITKQDGDVSLRSSRYKDLKDKKIKQFTKKEIPRFLVVRAIKK